jgi:hypothetical protein
MDNAHAEAMGSSAVSRPRLMSMAFLRSRGRTRTELVERGADIVEVGGESTRPLATSNPTPLNARRHELPARSARATTANAEG